MTCRLRQAQHPKWKGGHTTKGSLAWAGVRLNTSKQAARRCGWHEATGTAEEIVELWERCKGACEICKKSESDTGTLHLDHCHETGKIRGFLCARCNHVLGNAFDSTDTLRSAAVYLETR